MPARRTGGPMPAEPPASSDHELRRGRYQDVYIGKYRLVKYIATGGMGAVYRAFDQEQNRDVALKVMTPDKAKNPTLRKRFRREALLGHKLRHENIVGVYDCGEEAGV